MRKKSLLKYAYRLHTYVGIFVALHFVIFALSGLALLFKDEIQSTTGTVAHSATSVGVRTHHDLAESYSVILSNIHAAFPTDRPLALFTDEKNLNEIQVRLGANGETKLRGARRAIYELKSGLRITEPTKAGSGFFEWTLQIHRELFLGSTGKLYVGVLGLLYVFVLVTGFMIYGKFMKNREFGSVRVDRLPRLIDLHKFVGAVTFGWSLIVGLSGALLAFNGLLIKIFQAQSLKHLAGAYQSFKEVSARAPFDQVILSALDALPDSVISYISFPNTEFGIPGHYLFLMNGTTGLTERLSKIVVVNAQNGSLAEIVDLPFYLKLVLLSEPLHFGNYGGLFLKILWCAFTLGSLLVVLLGVLSYSMKRTHRRIHAAASKAPPIRSPKRLMVLPTSQYVWPTGTLFLILTSLVLALMTEGWMAKSAAALLVLPLLLLFLKGKRND